MINNIDHDKVRQKLIYMQDNLNKLKQLKAIDKDEFLKDFRNKDSAKYLLQVTIEAMVDISNHIIARNRWGKPETNKESFRILADNGVIQKENIETFSTMVKFRNRIVHMYYDVDDCVIYDILQNNLNDFEGFIKTLGKSIQY